MEIMSVAADANEERWQVVAGEYKKPILERL